MPTVQSIRTGHKDFFNIGKYIDLNLRNLSGDYVPIRFHAAPGLENDPKVDYLISLSGAVALGYKGFTKQQDIVVKNDLPEYEALNEDDYDPPRSHTSL